MGDRRGLMTPLVMTLLLWVTLRCFYQVPLCVCVCVCVCACAHTLPLSCVWLFATPWTVAHQAPLSMEFSTQEYRAGCHFLLQRIFPSQGWKISSVSPALAWRLFTTASAGKIPVHLQISSLENRRRQWHPTPVFLPGESHGRRSLVGCSPWGHEESDTTEVT